MRRALRSLSTVLIVVGALLLADAVATLLWQEPLSALYGRVQQGKLDDRLSAIEKAPLAAVDQRALQPAGRRAAGWRSRRARSPAAATPGDPLGRIRIPRIGVVGGLRGGHGHRRPARGPGHYPATPLPGQRGTVAIAGHRTTYGAPFHDVDDLRRGDPIVLAMPYGRFTYRVQRTRIVAADRDRGHRPRRLRPPGALRLPPAVLRRAADHRVRAARASRGPRARAAG